MAETQAQQLLKEAVVRETTEAISSQIGRMEDTIAEQNNKIDKASPICSKRSGLSQRK